MECKKAPFKKMCGSSNLRSSLKVIYISKCGESDMMLMLFKIYAILCHFLRIILKNSSYFHSSFSPISVWGSNPAEPIS